MVYREAFNLPVIYSSSTLIYYEEIMLYYKEIMLSIFILDIKFSHNLILVCITWEVTV